MEKVKIKICCGTSCFVMGAAQIQVLEFAPPADIADKIEIEEARCMNYCRNTTAKYNRGPFVLVNDELIEEANFEKSSQQSKRNFEPGKLMLIPKNNANQMRTRILVKIVEKFLQGRFADADRHSA